MIKKFLFVVLVFLNIHRLFGDSCYNQHYNVRDIRSSAINHVEKAKHLGLLSPFKYGNLTEESWCERFFLNSYYYSEFKEQFDYLFWWCDECIERGIQNNQRSVLAFQKQKDEEEVERHKQFIENLRHKQPIIQDVLHKGWEDVHKQFNKLYQSKIPFNDPLLNFQKGRLLFEEGKTYKSLLTMEEIINSGSFSDILNQLNKNKEWFYLDLAKGYSETNQYEKALQILNDLIQSDPSNKEAYFERAVTYFELGNFDLSIKDYLASTKKPIPLIEESVEAIYFTLGQTEGLVKGGVVGSAEFIPSTLSSIYGLSQGLWAFAEDPVQISKDLINATHSCIQFLRTNTSAENAKMLVPELRELLEDWDQLTSHQRGESIGYVIGKYGMDILAGAGLMKGMKIYRELKTANNMLTLEAMAISQRNAQMIKLEAVKRAQIRNEILNSGNLKIQWDKQGKHIQNHRNYQPNLNKSILEHSDPQNLIQKHAGTGIRLNGKNPGSAGYQEIINFNEFIGYAVNPDTGEKVATTWGKVHYATDGVHIVPTMPRGK